VGLYIHPQTALSALLAPAIDLSSVASTFQVLFGDLKQQLK
jgi:hypothetical protein